MVGTDSSENEGRLAVRRSASERKAALEERKRHLEAELAALSARERVAERKRDTRRKIIVGAGVLAHAALKPGFAEHLREALRCAVQRPLDRKAIADLLREAPNVSDAEHGVVSDFHRGGRSLLNVRTRVHRPRGSAPVL